MHVTITFYLIIIGKTPNMQHSYCRESKGCPKASQMTSKELEKQKQKNCTRKTLSVAICNATGHPLTLTTVVRESNIITSFFYAVSAGLTYFSTKPCMLCKL